MHRIPSSERLFFRLILVVALLALLPWALPLAAQEEETPDRPEAVQIETPEIEVPDIQIETTRETVWYADPVWILIGIGVVGVIVILIVLASRGGGGGTTVIRE